MGSATLMPLIASLEGCAWKLGSLRQDKDRLSRALAASQEATRISGMALGWPDWRPLPMGAAGLGLVIRLAPHVMPFDLEQFLELHFSKVGAQTEAMLARYVELGESSGASVEAISALLADLRRIRESGKTSEPAGLSEVA